MAARSGFACHGFAIQPQIADNLVFSARVNKSDGREMPDPATQRHWVTQSGF